MFQNSILNPNYDGDFVKYQFDEGAGFEQDSDEQDIDYSRDVVDIETYRDIERRNLPDEQHLREIQKIEETRRHQLGLD